MQICTLNIDFLFGLNFYVKFSICKNEMLSQINSNRQDRKQTNKNRPLKGKIFNRRKLWPHKNELTVKHRMTTVKQFVLLLFIFRKNFDVL